MSNAADLMDVRSTLADFVSYDASLQINEFLRTVLQYAYSETGGMEAPHYAQRALIVRLLTHSVQISDRYTCALTADLRLTVDRFEASPNSKALAMCIWMDATHEMADLQRAVRRIDPTFSIRGSLVDPVRYARCLESAISDTVQLTPEEQYVVYNAWAGCFTAVMRGTYSKYAKIVAASTTPANPTRQDLVDTMPGSLEACQLRGAQDHSALFIKAAHS
jgi:hypothetical protein